MRHAVFACVGDRLTEALRVAVPSSHPHNAVQDDAAGETAPRLVEVMGFMSDKIDTLLKEGRVIQPSARTKAAAHIPDYDQAYKGNESEGNYG